MKKTSGGGGGTSDKKNSSGGRKCGFCGVFFAADQIENHEKTCKSKPKVTINAPTPGTSTKANNPLPNTTPSKSNWKAQDAETLRQIREDRKSYHNLIDNLESQGKSARDFRDIVPMGGYPGGLSIFTTVIVIQDGILVPILAVPSRAGQPIDYSQYVECPHCGRHFSKEAAVRHIPQCQYYEYNKAEKEAFAKRKNNTNKKSK